MSATITELTYLKIVLIGQGITDTRIEAYKPTIWG